MARILVVEDDRDARLLISAFLSRAGHNVVPVESGQEAMFLVERDGLPAAVVLDLVMPGMNGFELLDRLRTTGMPGRSAVIVTGVHGVSARTRAFEQGVSWLPKPFFPSELAHAVRVAVAAA